MAGPEYARFGDNVIPYIGFMEFDQDDVDTLIAGGSFDGVIVSVVPGISSPPLLHV